MSGVGRAVRAAAGALIEKPFIVGCGGSCDACPLFFRCAAHARQGESESGFQFGADSPRVTLGASAVAPPSAEAVPILPDTDGASDDERPSCAVKLDADWLVQDDALLGAPAAGLGASKV